MKIYNYKTGKSVFVNNEKINITDAQAEVLEYFTFALPSKETPFADENDIFRIESSKDYTVKRGMSPNGEIIALYKDEEPVAALIKDRQFIVEQSKGLKEALINLF